MSNAVLRPVQSRNTDTLIRIVMRFVDAIAADLYISVHKNTRCRSINPLIRAKRAEHFYANPTIKHHCPAAFTYCTDCVIPLLHTGIAVAPTVYDKDSLRLSLLIPCGFTLSRLPRLFSGTAGVGIRDDNTQNALALL